MKSKIKLLIADSNRELGLQMKSFFDGKSDIGTDWGRVTLCRIMD